MRRILERAERRTRPGEERPRIPASASSFWFYEDSWLSKSSTFWVFDCGSREDCLAAVERLGGLEIQRDKLSPWQPSRYAVIMEGPASKRVEPNKKLRGSPWDVRGIRNGLVYELVIRDRDLYYYAIDLDRNRVYHLSEIGCFRGEEYRPIDK